MRYSLHTDFKNIRAGKTTKKSPCPLFISQLGYPYFTVCLYLATDIKLHYYFPVDVHVIPTIFSARMRYTTVTTFYIISPEKSVKHVTIIKNRSDKSTGMWVNKETQQLI